MRGGGVFNPDRRRRTVVIPHIRFSGMRTRTLILSAWTPTERSCLSGTALSSIHTTLSN